ncbi:MAG TPA: proton-conducting transporter membrane subunit [Dehalococcoidia bacterium]|nr:proton-conducting transporter membrane subunit [Dehalococcoidia bacterium]
MAAALSLAAAVSVVEAQDVLTLSLWHPAPYAALELRLDAVGAVFMAIVAGVALVSSSFGYGYARHSAVDAAVYPLFLLSMLSVTAAGNVYTFLLAWEGMALTSFVLVLGDGSASPRRQAALLYLVMTHVATVFVAASFFIVAQSAGTTTFADMEGTHLSLTSATLAFLFAVVGFGTKAGLVPLHVWLPRAHPVAPSHVSALMSAAMVKTGLYGIIRVGFFFLEPGPTWWGLALVGVGAVGAVLAVLYALMENDIKRVLAYSTVENVGLICLALGAALALRSEGELTLSAVLLTAGLLHATNHAWFKSLLFLGAGIVQRAAHTLHLDNCGGLARLIPVTGVAVLVGSLSGAALPPFNGFAGEWLMVRGLIGAGSAQVSDGIRLASLTAVAAIGLTSGLAVACYVRFFGLTFLGLPRTPAAAAAKEPSFIMAGTLAVLAAGCIVSGLAAAFIGDWLQSVPQSLLGTTGVASDGARLDVQAGGSFSPAFLAGALVLLAPLPWILARALYGRSSADRGPIWATGIAFRPSMQYTGASFSKPIRLFFSSILLPERRIEVAYHGSSPLPSLVRYTGRVPLVFEERLYLPLQSFLFWASSRLRTLQAGSVQLYLLYMMAALALLLVVSR